MNQYKKLDPSIATDDEIILCALAIEQEMSAEEKTNYIIESFLFVLHTSRVAKQKGATTANALLGSLVCNHFHDTINNLQSDKVLIKEKPTKNL